MVTHREKRALANSQEETRQKSASKVVGDSGQDGDETPKDHTNGEIYGRFPNIIEEHVPFSMWRRGQQNVRPGPRVKDVRGNLHGDVPDIEDTQDGSELVSSET